MKFFLKFQILSRISKFQKYFCERNRCFLTGVTLQWGFWTYHGIFKGIFTCMKCSKTFKHLYKMNSHIILEHVKPELKLKCDYCEKSNFKYLVPPDGFISEATLNQHILNLHTLLSEPKLVQNVKKCFTSRQNIMNMFMKNINLIIHLLALIVQNIL